MGKYDPTPDARKAAIAEAARAGHHLVMGHSTLLQIDIDYGSAFATTVELIRQFRHHIGAVHAYSTRSKSGNLHVFVQLAEPMRRQDRLFWQAVFGSDPVREALNWLWMRAGHRSECFLVETSDPNLRHIPLEDQ